MAMARMPGHAAIWTLSAAGIALLTGAAPGGGQAAQEVRVVNFPSPQRIEGTVEVRQPVTLAWQAVRRKATVLPARPAQLRELTDGGKIETMGFSRMAVSLAGVTTSRIVGPGTVGVILVPNDTDLLTTWQETGIAQLALRVEAAVAPSDHGLFEAGPVELRPAFPSYRVFFYDTLSASVELRLHVYLTSS